MAVLPDSPESSAHFVTTFFSKIMEKLVRVYDFGVVFVAALRAFVLKRGYSIEEDADNMSSFHRYFKVIFYALIKVAAKLKVNLRLISRKRFIVYVKSVLEASASECVKLGKLKFAVFYCNS